MLLMRFICETLADMGTWRPYNGARRSCPGRAGRGAAHGDRRDLQLTVRGIDQKDFIMARPSSQPYLHDSSAQASEQAPQARPTASTATKCATRGSLRWRVIDIAVGAAVGVMFWVFDGLSYGLFPLLTLILPGSAALLHALFYFPATLGLLIVRKPGASAYVLLVASFVEVVLGTKYSVSLVVIALVQALAAEAVFAVFRYRRWTLGVTLLSAVAIGICIQLLPVVLLLPGVFVLQSAWTHRHGMRVAERGRIRRVRFVGPLPSLGQVGSPHPLRLRTMTHARGNLL